MTFWPPPPPAPAPPPPPRLEPAELPPPPPRPLSVSSDGGGCIVPAAWRSQPASLNGSPTKSLREVAGPAVEPPPPPRLEPGAAPPPAPVEGPPPRLPPPPSAGPAPMSTERPSMRSGEPNFAITRVPGSKSAMPIRAFSAEPTRACGEVRCASAPTNTMPAQAAIANNLNVPFKVSSLTNPFGCVRYWTPNSESSVTVILEKVPGSGIPMFQSTRNCRRKDSWAQTLPSPEATSKPKS